MRESLHIRVIIWINISYYHLGTRVLDLDVKVNFWYTNPGGNIINIYEFKCFHLSAIQIMKLLVIYFF